VWLSNGSSAFYRFHRWNCRNSTANSSTFPFSPQQEYEHRILPWLWSFGIFIFFRFFAFLFFAIVNDLIFFYNIGMTMLWIVIISVSIYGWLVVYSLFLELSDLTKLEDLAHLRVRQLFRILRISTDFSFVSSRWERCSR
jgi:hypothetical protein